MKNRKIALVLVLFVAATTMAAYAKSHTAARTQTSVVTRSNVQIDVPGTTNGAFGNPVDQAVPFVPALTVSGPGTITVTYVSGMINFGGGDTGPSGTRWNERGLQLPLQEAHGVSGGWVNNIGALIGAFVPQSRASRSGFTAIDGTKNATRVGIRPGTLFFIGESKIFDVKEAGTLFLGINDQYVGDNSGAFTVEVTGP